jgi:hypothetical protein
MRIAMTTLALVALLAGCGGRAKGYETLATQANDGKAANLIKAADALWEQRGDEAKLKAALAKYEEAAKAAPTNRHVHTRLVRGWYFHADTMAQGKDAQIESFDKAKSWGQRCMAINTDFTARLDNGDKPKDALEAMTLDDAPCVYWTASALGKWAKANGILKSLKYIGTVKAYISFVEDKAPTFWYYGPARYWGAYYSIAPGMAGGDPKKSPAYFEASIKGEPRYLGSYVLRAENTAVKLQDVKTFDDDIEFVLNFDVSSFPELAPENAKEQEKARILKGQRAELFDKKALEAAQ